MIVVLNIQRFCLVFLLHLTNFTHFPYPTFRLQFSKIGKVMRHITALSDEKVPLDNKYHFRDRAKVLVEVWQHIINASKDNNNTSSNTNNNTNNKNHRNGTSTSNAKKATTDSQSPGAENVNGIADAINSSIAGGTMEVDEDTKLNGHGHGPNNHPYNGGEDILRVAF